MAQPETSGFSIRSRRPIRQRSGWPAGFLGMLALVMVVEFTVVRSSARSPSPALLHWREVGRSIDKAVGSDVVVLGDSLLKYDLVSPVIEARLGAGRQVYNLAVPGGCAPSSYFLLRRLLDKGGRPSIVLTDGETFDVNPLDRASAWSELLTPGELLEFSRRTGDGAFLGARAVELAVPSVGARASLRLSLLDFIGGRSETWPTTVEVLRRNLAVNRGGVVLHDNYITSDGDPRLADLERIGYMPPPFGCRLVNHLYVMKFLELAARHEIKVVWLLPPYHPEVQRRATKGGRMATYAEYIRGLLTLFPNLSVASAWKGNYPPETLTDMTHLGRTGAIIFSDNVGRYIRRKLEGQTTFRWVELERYDAHAVEALAEFALVEDDGRSYQVLKGIELARASRTTSLMNLRR